MSLFFPFDTSLRGYVEEVDIDILSLDYPIIVFPKGSFFVSELYGIVKGTNRIVRPGIDFKVLSLNETIKFNNDHNLNKTLEENYVRNAVLWRGASDIGIVTWHVPYCGGEETTKVAEYNNYLNDLYNDALGLGTANLLTTPNQGWGGYVDVKNEQIVSGTNIYHKYFDYYEDMNQRGGLGWGKVQLSIMALADVVTSGGDPLEIQAYYDWIRHNETEFTNRKDGLFVDLHDRINNLDAKRVGIDQFIYSNQKYDHYSKQHFLEHNNVILRGLDPNEQGFVQNPIYTKRNDTGFYGLADWGTDIDLRSIRLSQRKTTASDKNVFKTKFLTLDAINPNDPSRIYWSVGCDNKALAKSGKDYWMYIVSKRLGRVIQQVSINDLAYNNSIQTLSGNFTYPNLVTDYADDILFGYILDRPEMTGDFNEIKRSRYVSYHRNYGYAISANSRGLVLSSGEVVSKNPTMDDNQDNAIGTGNIEVIVTRKFGDYPETNYLGMSKITDAVATTLKTLNWGIGETRKVVNLFMNANMFAENNTILIQLLRSSGNYTNPNNELANVVMGYRNVTNVNNAYIKIVPSENAELQEVIMNESTRHYLVVKYAKNVDYHRVKPVLKVTEYQLSDVGVGTIVNKGMLGEPTFVNQGKVIYPIQFTGFNNSQITPITVELIDNNATFSTNRINLFIENDLPTSLDSQTFTPLSVIRTTVVGGEEVVFRYRSNNPGVFPEGTSSFRLDNDKVDVVILNPPVYFNDVLEYKLFFPITLVGQTINTTVSYRIAAGYMPMMGNSFTYPQQPTQALRLYGQSGLEITHPILNEPFRIMYRPPSIGVDKVNVVVDSTMADRSPNVKFGGDAIVNLDGSYTITKPDVNTLVGNFTQVSVDGWLTITEIDKSVSVDNRDYGVLYMKITPSPGGVVEYQKMTIPLSLIDVKFFDMGGVELGNNVHVNASFITTFTSKEINLDEINSIEVSGVSDITVTNFIVHIPTNTLTAVVSVGAGALGSNKTISFKLNGPNPIDLKYRKQFNFL